ncbi:unnamed protein product [Urochloa humidicola]
MAQVQGSPAWTDLPPELLGLVFLRLPTRADLAFFPAVCRTWSSVARQCRLPSPSPVPWLVPGGNAISFPHGETFQLPEGVRYHNSCAEWLLLSRDDDSCFLMNPFTKATMPLPNLSSYSYYKEPVEIPEDCMPRENDMRGPWSYNEDAAEISVLSLVVCSARLVAAIVVVGDLGTIALCRPGASAWSVSSDEDCRWLSHLVFFQGKLYALDGNTDPEDLIAIHIVDDHGCNEPRVSGIERLIQGASLPHQKYSFCLRYLLESHGTLLMIRRKLSYKSEHPSERRYGGTLVAGSSKFEVFEADFEEGLWSEVRTLGNDQALFLGRGCSRAVHMSPYDLSCDCLFFIDDYTDWTWKKTTTSCGVYDMKDGKVYSSLPMVSWKSVAHVLKIRVDD